MGCAATPEEGLLRSPSGINPLTTSLPRIVVIKIRAKKSQHLSWLEVFGVTQDASAAISAS